MGGLIDQWESDRDRAEEARRFGRPRYSNELTGFFVETSKKQSEEDPTIPRIVGMRNTSAASKKSNFRAQLTKGRRLEAQLLMRESILHDLLSREYAEESTREALQSLYEQEYLDRARLSAVIAEIVERIGDREVSSSYEIDAQREKEDILSNYLWHVYCMCRDEDGMTRSRYRRVIRDSAEIIRTLTSRWNDLDAREMLDAAMVAYFDFKQADDCCGVCGSVLYRHTVFCLICGERIER